MVYYYYVLLTTKFLSLFVFCRIPDSWVLAGSGPIYVPLTSLSPSGKATVSCLCFPRAPRNPHHNRRKRPPHTPPQQQKQQLQQLLQLQQQQQTETLSNVIQQQRLKQQILFSNTNCDVNKVSSGEALQGEHCKDELQKGNFFTKLPTPTSENNAQARKSVAPPVNKFNSDGKNHKQDLKVKLEECSEKPFLVPYAVK